MTESDRPHVTSRWEWVAAAASALLVLGTVGFLLYEGLGRADTPVAVEVVVDDVVPVPGAGYLVRVTARNRGRSSAAAVDLEGRLRLDTATVETSTATIAHLPGASSREAGLFFSRDPRKFELEVRAIGFEVP